MNNAAMNNCVQVGVGRYVFILLEYVPKCGIAGSYCYSSLYSFEEMSDFFQSSCTNLHSHERWRRVPVSPHSHGCEVVSLWWLPLFLRTFLNVCKKFFRGCSLSAETMSLSHQVGNNV